MHVPASAGQPMPAAFLSAALLLDSAQRSVRVIAQARLQRVLEEAARVEVRASVGPPALLTAGPGTDTTDPEAIHDFRVALRRLRAWLRAFRPYLADTVRRGPERRLRTLSRLAGRARDLEVQYQWLTGPRRGRPGPEREAARWLAERVGREQTRARRALAKGLLTELPEASARFAEALQYYHREIALEEPAYERMAAAMAEAVRQATDTLAGDLQRVHRLDQVEEAHAARISAKRLRYLLEGFGRASRSAMSVLAQLTALQHLFGELHDAQVLQHRLRAVRPARKGSGSDTRGGTGRPATSALEALRALLVRRVGTAFRQVHRAIRSPATSAMFTRLTALIRRLERTELSGNRPVAIGPLLRANSRDIHRRFSRGQ
jgi:CHAD domain-containing protein